MILSISRRTDIPAFYPDWFYNRVKEGFVYVRNPMNTHQVSKIPINRDVVDCMVFWTKNPEKMLARLSEIDNFNYYFQFSVNPYNQRIEKAVPAKKEIIETFQRLSDKIGPNRVIWRYDPILYSDDLDYNYHLKNFEFIARKLRGFSHTCVISFLDNYKKTERNIKQIKGRELTDMEVEELSKSLGEISRINDFKIQTCAEKYDLDKYGIKHGRCIDNEVVESIIGKKIKATKDKNQRKECGCIQSIDIGEYNTCQYGCVYCYANSNQKVVNEKVCMHNPDSPLLIGEIQEKDIIKEREVHSLIKTPPTLLF